MWRWIVYNEKQLQTVGSFSVLFCFVLPQRQEDARTLNPWGVRRTARVIPSFSAEPQMLKCCFKWPVCFSGPLQVEWMVTLRLLRFGQINRQSTEKCHHELLVCGIAVREVSPAHLIRPRRWLVPVVFAPSGDGCDAGDFFFFSVISAFCSLLEGNSNKWLEPKWKLMRRYYGAIISLKFKAQLFMWLQSPRLMHYATVQCCLNPVLVGFKVTNVTSRVPLYR